MADTGLPAGAAASWYGAARYILDTFGFVPYRNGFLQKGRIYAFIDSHKSPVSQRYVGFFDLRLDGNMREMMHPVALIPWYGDGETCDVASHMVSGIAHLLIHGVDDGQRQAVQEVTSGCTGGG